MRTVKMPSVRGARRWVTYPFGEIAQEMPVLAARSMGVRFSVQRHRAIWRWFSRAGSKEPNHPSLVRLIMRSALSGHDPTSSRQTAGVVASKQMGVTIRAVRPDLVGTSKTVWDEPADRSNFMPPAPRASRARSSQSSLEM